MKDIKKFIRIPSKEEFIAEKLAEGSTEEVANDYADESIRICKIIIQGMAKESAKCISDHVAGVFEHDIPVSTASKRIHAWADIIVSILQEWENADVSQKEEKDN